LQHLILVVGDSIADVLVQQVVADQSEGEFSRTEPAILGELRRVADFRTQVVVTCGRRLDSLTSFCAKACRRLIRANQLESR
jgi:hypothetical protein